MKCIESWKERSLSFPFSAQLFDLFLHSSLSESKKILAEVAKHDGEETNRERVRTV